MTARFTTYHIGDLGVPRNPPISRSDVQLDDIDLYPAIHCPGMDRVRTKGSITMATTQASFEEPPSVCIPAVDKPSASVPAAANASVTDIATKQPQRQRLPTNASRDLIIGYEQQPQMSTR